MMQIYNVIKFSISGSLKFEKDEGEISQRWNNQNSNNER